MSTEATNSKNDIAGSPDSTSNPKDETADEAECIPNPVLKSPTESSMEEQNFTRQKKRIRFCPIVVEKQYIVSNAPTDTVLGTEATKLLKDAEERKEGKQNTPNTWNKGFDERETNPDNIGFQESNARDIYLMKMREITHYLEILQKNSLEERKTLMHNLNVQ